MIYYPICTLLEIDFQKLFLMYQILNHPSLQIIVRRRPPLGINSQYECQFEPKGLVEAFLIGESFIGKGNVTLILFYNFCYSPNLMVEI